jgi:hypothetical protein
MDELNKWGSSWILVKTQQLDKQVLAYYGSYRFKRENFTFSNGTRDFIQRC